MYNMYNKKISKYVRGNVMYNRIKVLTKSRLA